MACQWRLFGGSLMHPQDLAYSHHSDRIKDKLLSPSLKHYTHQGCGKKRPVLQLSSRMCVSKWIKQFHQLFCAFDLELTAVSSKYINTSWCMYVSTGLMTFEFVIYYQKQWASSKKSWDVTGFKISYQKDSTWKLDCLAYLREKKKKNHIFTHTDN